MSTDEQAKIRGLLVREIEKDIVGPRQHDEFVNRNPANEYLAGVLFPAGWDDPEEDNAVSDSTEIGDDHDETNTSIQNHNFFKPSSFGLTCTLDPNTDSVTALLTYGTYEKAGNKYRRTPRSEKFTIDVSLEEQEMSFAGRPEFVIWYKAIRKEDHTALEVYVINKCKITTQTRVADLLFQPELVLESVGKTGAFMDASPLEQEDDVDGFAMLFSDKASFGKGRLCAVTWDEDARTDNKRVKSIRTTFVPKQIVELISPETIPQVLPCMDMVRMGECSDRQELAAMLGEMVSMYESWTDAQLGSISSEHTEFGNRHIRECKDAAVRMRKSIQILLDEDDAFEAFKFANMAIAWQQTMSGWAKANAAKGEVSEHEPLKPDRKKWRLFQIAFILLNLESVVNPHSKDRDTVDLLWFPTGGGKTEAYLGLAAFVVAHRRLRGKEDGNVLTEKSIGTSVLMRYTLRLLTVQQFQRAATLMCACEKIRTADVEKWGKVPFQVGLWVGDSVSPNRRSSGDSSAEQIKHRLGGKDLSQIHYRNPYILLNCPWCGKKLRSVDGEVSGIPLQWRLYCSRNKCMFSKHLDTDTDRAIPVVLVDEDVYSRCPSIIIATVDKFARISWKGECRSIFGRATKYCERHGFYNPEISDSHNHKNTDPPRSVEPLPPELIIQDELHLISGALGSMASMYETAIDHLCTTESGVRPKLIASTATTRNAADQIQKLFNRDRTHIFPPQVLKFGDTFFSKKDPLQDSGRLYIGILGTSKSMLNVLTRVSAVILGYTRRLAESGEYDVEDLDPYISLVSYFNSHKELGGAGMGYKDSVPELIRRLEKFDQVSPETSLNTHSTARPQIFRRQFSHLNTEEMTSRKASGEIPSVLRKLDVTLKDDPVDVLLATNMLSVGVDISRLSAMIVNGHPKNHSEYIQATGRIGRRSPGLVVTLYSYTKPRDLSVYEDFQAYHQTFFKYVEPSSITPFTARARDLALFGVMVGLVRMQYPEFVNNNDARRFDPKDRDQQLMIEGVKKVLLDRVIAIDPSEESGTEKDIDLLIRKWTKYNEKHHGVLKYANQYNEKASKSRTDSYMYLLKSHPESDKELIGTPTSLRNAEQEQKLFYIGEVDCDDE